MLVNTSQNDIRPSRIWPLRHRDAESGWTRAKEAGGRLKHPCNPSSTPTKSRATTGDLIMQARVIAGWIQQSIARQNTEAAEPPTATGLTAERSHVSLMLRF